jgi:hypothetical protein
MLVLWLNQEAFETTPLSSLHEVGNLFVAHLRNKKTPNRKVDVKILGPVDSGVLTPLARDIASKTWGRRKPSSGLPLQIVSASATATLDLPEAKTGLCRSQFCVEGHGAQLLRVIGPDSRLTKALYGELRSRVAKAPEGRKQIVIAVHESDTEYGRDLVGTRTDPGGDKDKKSPEVGKNQEEDRGHGEHDHQEREDIRALRELGFKLRTFSYLRGLDGHVPGADADARKEKSEVNAANLAPSRETSARSHGLHQTDYLRRLVSDIKEYSARSTGDPKAKEKEDIVGIALLGNDVYDKLLLLRALKPEFPGAVFLTTDLDARLLDSEEAKWARNLIVASNYGLALYPALQLGIPSFRDNYQTATYLAASLIARDCAATTIKAALENDRQMLPWLSVPLLFEIGRSKAVPLTQVNVSPNESTGTPALSRCGYENKPSFVQPSLTVPRPPAWPRVLGGTLAVAVLAWVIARIARGRAAKTSQPIGRRANKRLDVVQRVLPDPLEPGWAAIFMPAVLVAIGFAAMMYIGDVTWTSGVTALGLLMLLPTIMAMGFSCFAVPACPKQSQDAAEGHGRLLLAVLLLGLALFIPVQATHGIWSSPVQMEPFEWLQGVSAWPSQMLRILACVLAIWAFWHLAIERRGAAGEIDRALARYQPNSLPAVRHLWRRYRGRRSVRRRFCLSVFAFVMFFATVAAVNLVFGEQPIWPVRGAADRGQVIVLAIYSFYLALALLGAVFAACCAFVTEILDPLIRRSEATPFDTEGGNLKRAVRVAANRLAAVDLVVRQSEVLLRYVYYPFAVFALLLLARSSLFDSWQAPLSVIVTYAFAFLVTVGCVAWIRFKTYAFQRTTTREMRASLQGSLGVGECRGTADDPRIRKLELMMETVETERRGSFQSLALQPLIRALLLPIGGASGLEVVEHLLLR